MYETSRAVWMPPANYWPLPSSARMLEGLDWGSAGLPSLAEMVFGPPESQLKIVQHSKPVLRRGSPASVFVFVGADERTRLMVSRRLLRIVVDYGAVCEAIWPHEEANASRGGCIALTVEWECRDSVRQLLLASLEQDQTLSRMLLRAGMESRRHELDQKVIRNYFRRGGTVLRHYRGPRSLRYRFSDFRAEDRVDFGLGMFLKLSFDDHEILDFARQRFNSFAADLASRGVPCLLHAKPPRHRRKINGADTDMLWYDETIVIAATLNRKAARFQAATFLSLACGLDGVDLPVSESFESEGFQTTGPSPDL